MNVLRSSFVVLVIVGLGVFASAQTTRKTGILYVPKVKGATKQRTDGATRGGGEAPAPKVRVLLPQETAVVAGDRPRLYWSIDRPTKFGCDVVVKTADDEPVFEQHFDGVKAGGLMAFDLSKGQKKLEAGKDYRFVVLVSVQPTDPAGDIESSGTLRYEPGPPGVAASLSATDRAAAYAEQGYFVDAVATLAGDGSDAAKAALADLLAQAKLDVKP